MTSLRDRLKWLLMGASTVSLCLFAFGLRAQKPATEKSKTAHQAFKNVQILKDIPADQLVPAMQFIAASLGVECDFCHVRDAFEKDDKKPKQTARRMIQMVLAIDQQTFQGRREVTCYTCHRGSTKPVGIPMIGDTAASYSESAIPSDEVAPPASSNADSSVIRNILEKYVAALGGAAAIERVSTRVERGKASVGAGPSLGVEIISKAPNKEIMTVHLPSGDTITAFDGKEGWTSSPGVPVREMNRADIEGARIDADLQFAVHLKNLYTGFKLPKPAQAEPREGERDMVMLVATNPDQPPLELYFDKASGLLLRQLRFANSPLGLNPTRIDYDDYRNFDGVKVPLHVTIARPNRTIDIRFDEVTQNVPVTDSKFTAPTTKP